PDAAWPPNLTRAVKEHLMAFKPLVILLAAAMLGSLFLPWLATPAGNIMVPWDLIKQIKPDQALDVMKQSPPEVWALVASFALAALLVVTCLLGIESKLVGVLTGAIPLALVGYGIYHGANAASDLGVPQLRLQDWNDMLNQIKQTFGPGLYAWLGGAALLFVVSFLDPGRRAR
ncbi:MAG: hypothetical protein ABIV25_06945, partial [Paracoccaceae bacterium]